ncbi:MAG: methylmalonyl-CoA mutase subunit beta, partial [Polyangiales bacterium]
MTDRPTFNAFAPVSRAAWIAKVEADLQGAAFDSLRSTVPGGMAREPLYTAEDRTGPPGTGMPGLFPYARGATPVAGWQIRQEYGDPRLEVSAETLRRDLAHGVEAVWIKTGPRFGTRVTTVADLDRLLAPVDLATTSVYLEPGVDPIAVGAGLIAVAEQRGVGATGVRGCFGADPVGVLAREGRIQGGLQVRMAEVRELGVWCAEHAPLLSAICVSGDPYHNAGASAVQEVAAVIATAVSYLRNLTDAGLGIDAAARQIRFAFSVSSDFFGEIAKLRAARWIWAQALSAAGAEPGAATMSIHARTSAFTKTERDPWVNMLRATSECTAAILGGAQSVATLPFDTAIGSPDQLTRRVARNTQVVLREESHLGAVADPAGGSWYVESMTREIARTAWEEFQRIEGEGGITASLGSGRITDRIAAVSAERRTRIAKRKTPIVGVSEFPNLDEPRIERERVTQEEIAKRTRESLEALDLGASRSKLIAIARAMDAIQETPGELMDACVGAAMTGTDMYSISTVLQHGQPDFYLEPLSPWRQSDAWEGLRARSDRRAADGPRPSVFLANLGPIPAHKARSAWTGNLFAAAGIASVANDGFESVDDLVAAYLESGAGMAAICGSDADYGV